MHNGTLGICTHDSLLGPSPNFGNGGDSTPGYAQGQVLAWCWWYILDLQLGAWELNVRFLHVRQSNELSPQPPWPYPLKFFKTLVTWDQTIIQRVECCFFKCHSWTMATLHTAPCTPPGMTPEDRARSKSWVPPGVETKQNKNLVLEAGKMTQRWLINWNLILIQDFMVSWSTEAGALLAVTQIAVPPYLKA